MVNHVKIVKKGPYFVHVGSVEHLQATVFALEHPACVNSSSSQATDHSSSTCGQTNQCFMCKHMGGHAEHCDAVLRRSEKQKQEQ
jgi:hypothetical protein